MIQKRRGPFSRFRNIILFLIRAGIVASLVLFAAGVFVSLRQDAFAGIDTYAVLFDTSPSTRRTAGDADVFTELRMGAREIGEAIFESHENARVVLFTDSAEPESLYRYEDYAAALDAVTVSDIPFMLSERTTRAKSYMLQNASANFAYVIASDFQRSNAHRLRPQTEHAILYIPSEGETANHGILEATPWDTVLFRADTARVNLRIRRQNFTRASQVRVYQGNVLVATASVAQSREPEQTVAVSIPMKQSGFIPLRFELDDDAYIADNTAYVPLYVEERIRFLVVDPTYRDDPRFSPGRLFASALSATDITDDDAPMQFQFVDSVPASVSGYDVLAVFGDDISGAAFDRMANAIRAGVDVFFFPGEALSPRTLANGLRDSQLLPTLSARIIRDEAGRRIQPAETNAPLFAPFAGNETLYRDLRAASHFSLSLAGNRTVIRIPFSFDDGSPALLSRYDQTHRATMVLSAIPTGVANASFYISPFYVVFVRHALFTVRGRKIVAEQGDVGAPVSLSPLAGEDLIRFTGVEAEASLLYDDTYRLEGFYQSENALFAARIPAHEHDIERDMLTDSFSEIIRVEGEAGLARFADVHGGVSLRYPLLALALLLLAFEFMLSTGASLAEIRKRFFSWGSR